MVVYPNEYRNESTQISNIEQQQNMDEREEQFQKQIYVSVEFEVYGKVQGEFRYCTFKLVHPIYNGAYYSSYNHGKMWKLFRFFILKFLQAFILRNIVAINAANWT